MTSTGSTRKNLIGDVRPEHEGRNEANDFPAKLCGQRILSMFDLDLELQIHYTF